jgi:alkylation response protein AidB-like acyl-CoA dehydrogenase
VVGRCPRAASSWRGAAPRGGSGTPQGDRAIQTHGGNGLADEYGLADLWFIVRLLRIAPVSREMIINYVAQHPPGLPGCY